MFELYQFTHINGYVVFAEPSTHKGRTFDVTIFTTRSAQEHLTLSTGVDADRLADFINDATCMVAPFHPWGEHKQRVRRCAREWSDSC